jgi:hypothetical protein
MPEAYRKAHRARWQRQTERIADRFEANAADINAARTAPIGRCGVPVQTTAAAPRRTSRSSAIRPGEERLVEDADCARRQPFTSSSLSNTRPYRSTYRR